MTGASATDVVQIPNEPRQQDMKATQRQVSQLTRRGQINAQLEAQHRALLVALGDISNEAVAVSAGSLTVSGTYTQAEIEALRDRVQELTTAVNSLKASIDVLVGLPDTHLAPFSSGG